MLTPTVFTVGTVLTVTAVFAVHAVFPDSLAKIYAFSVGKSYYKLTGRGKRRAFYPHSRCGSICCDRVGKLLFGTAVSAFLCQLICRFTVQGSEPLGDRSAVAVCFGKVVC